MATLPTYQSKVIRGLVTNAALNLLLTMAVLLLVRPVLVERLAEDYLQGLGRFVREDIRYVLLVRDPVTMGDYIEDLAGLPWMHSVALLDREAQLLQRKGTSNWTAPVEAYTSMGEVRVVEDQAHLLLRIDLSDAADRPAGALLHVTIVDERFSRMIDQVLYLIVFSIATVTLALFGASIRSARRATRVVTRLSADMQAVDPERGVLRPITVDTGIREFDAVQQSFNTLVRKVDQHNEDLERRIRDRTHDLAAALAQKNMAEAVRSSLIMNLSHDLKTPLTANVGYLDHAVEELESSSPDLDVLRHVISSARGYGRTLAEEVNTLLQYSITSSDLSRIHHKRVNVRTLLENAIEASSAMQGASGNTLHFDYNGRRFMVTAERLLRHVIDNLLANAHRYCVGGHVTVRCSVTETLHLSVSDTGPGVPEAERESVFEPHFRLSASERLGPKGMGIGLALTKTWIDHLGGTITLQPTGMGARFEVRIPETALSAKPIAQA